jgi:hypothetical protein
MKNLLTLFFCLTMAAGAIAQDYKAMVAKEMKAANMENASALLGFDINENTEVGKVYGEISKMFFENGSKRFDLIKKYADNKNNLTPAVANELIKESLKLNKERNKIMQKMSKKLGKHLSPANLIALMQYESKKQALIDAALARIVPFANM